MMEERLNKENSESFSLSVGDLMAALLLIFVLLLVTTILRVQQQTIAINKIEEIRKHFYDELNKTFKDDLPRWNAVIDSNLTIRFSSDPEFDGPRFFWANPGDYSINDDHSLILDSFFPRYVDILHKDTLSKYIKEIRIEGHTDITWSSPGDAYIRNMELSQNRTRSILEESLTTIQSKDVRSWVTGIITSVGHSSSRLLNRDQPDDPMNRRVEFRIDLQEYLILQELQSR